MKLLVAVENASWGRIDSMRQDQGRLSSFAEVLRVIADRLANGGSGDGVESFVREKLDGSEIEVSYHFEREPPAEEQEEEHEDEAPATFAA